MSWKLNGTNLTAGNVAVVVAPGSLTEANERHYRHYPRLGYESVRRVHGRDLPTLRLRFDVVGPATDRYATATTIRQTLLTGDDFILEAPASPNEVKVFEDSKAARLSCNRADILHQEGVAWVSVQAECTILAKLTASGEASVEEGVGAPEVGFAEPGLEDPDG